MKIIAVSQSVKSVTLPPPNFILTGEAQYDDTDNTI